MKGCQRPPEAAVVITDTTCTVCPDGSARGTIMETLKCKGFILGAGLTSRLLLLRHNVMEHQCFMYGASGQHVGLRALPEAQVTYAQTFPWTPPVWAQREEWSCCQSGLQWSCSVDPLKHSSCFLMFVISQCCYKVWVKVMVIGSI